MMRSVGSKGMKRAIRFVAVAMVSMVASSFASTTPVATGLSYQRISGEGSSWAANAIDAMRVNVQQFGITVDYNPSGSTAGRKNFLNGTVDFAASDIPFQFQPEDGSAPESPAPGSYAYMPIVAGGTAFMYNLKINGKPVTNLRLSGENVAKLFTGAITMWNDPAIQADNPGLTMPARAVVPVVRSDGSGSSAQFTGWMINQHGAVWQTFCEKSGRAPACGQTSFYPTINGMISQNGDLGVSGYVSQSFAEGAIGYVNYSYALGTQFPVAKVLNAAGYYTEPTPENVAVSLLQAKINTDESNPSTYLTQKLEGVYTDPDPRNYQLSSYSYLILPTKVAGQFNEDKGLTLGAFAYYAVCQAQQQSASLGYSPLPVNLVEASFEQIRKVPGVAVQDINISSCKNPTFSADGTNVLAQSAKQPQACDKQGASQCPDGTGGMANVPTAVLAAAQAGPVPAATTPAAGGATGTPAAGGATGTPAAGGATGTPAAGGATGTPAAGGATGTPAAGGATGTPVVDASGNPVVDAAGNPVVDAAGAPLVDANGQPVAQVDPAACDADLGTCGGTAAAGTGTAAAASAAPVLATTLDQATSWGSSKTLVALVILLALGLVLIPAVAWRYFSGTAPS
jgi:phosphate ABC transporter phosphate-binding protein